MLLLAKSGAAPSGRVVTSQSRQFQIYSPDQTFLPDKIPQGSVVVEPDWLAMTAERVRAAVVAEIPAMGSIREQIEVGILQRAPADGTIGVGTTVFADGFKYKVAIPPVVDEVRLVKGFISVLLAQYANHGGNRAVELPTWVIEGVAQTIFHSVGPKLVVDGNSSGWEMTTRDMLAHTREILRTNAPPTFHEVTMGAPPAPQSPNEAFYKSCTHLLTRSLLQRPQGREQFARFLRNLPKAWNWQTAFREAFGFERMLDVEKWWALAMVEFTMRDQRQAFSTPVSLEKLNTLLGTPMEMHSATNALPETRMVDLQTLLEKTDWQLQAQALRDKISQLGYTANHLAPPVGTLALQYKAVLQSYLTKRANMAVRPTLRTTPEAQRKTLAAEAVRRLAALDARRQKLSEPTVSSAR
jgi:hypothetical protein